MPVHFQNNKIVINSKSYKPNHRRSLSQRLKSSKYRSPLTLNKLEQMKFRSPNKTKSRRRSLEPPPKSPRRSIHYIPRSPTTPPPPLPRSAISLSIVPKKSLTRSRRSPALSR